MKEFIFVMLAGTIAILGMPILSAATAGYGRKRKGGGGKRKIEHSHLIFKGGGAPPPPPPPPPPQFSRQVTFRGKVGGGTQAGGGTGGGAPAPLPAGAAPGDLDLAGDITNAMAQVGNKKNLGA